MEACPRLALTRSAGVGGRLGVATVMMGIETDSLLDDPDPNDLADTLAPVGRRHSPRPPKTCSCHPPTLGHLYGPDLVCYNRGCHAVHPDPTPCFSPIHRRGRVVKVATQFSVVSPL